MRKLKLPTILLSLLSIFVLGLFVTPSTALAANNCDTSSPTLDLSKCLTLNNKTGTTVGDVYKNPAVLINLIVSNIFIAGGLILLVMIIYAGFQFISGGAKGAEQAKSVLTTAIMGFVIMFLAYWILKVISIITGANILF